MPKTMLEHYVDHSEELRQHIKPGFVDLAASIGRATMVRAYHNTVITGVVQTPFYRHTLNIAEDGVRRPAFWLAGSLTQAIRHDLNGREASVRVILPTEVLGMPADTDPTVKREQLEVLKSHAVTNGRARTLQLLGVGARDVVGLPFVVLSDGDGPFATYYEGAGGEPSVLDQNPARARDEADRFDTLSRAGGGALSLAASQELLEAELALLPPL